MRRGILLFLYGNPNIAGSALALVGLGLFFAGVIKAWWFFIVAGLYAIGYLLAPRGTAHLQLHRQLTNDEIRAGLEELERALHGRVTAPVRERVASIKESLLALLPQLEQLDGGSHHLHVVRQTAGDYLPAMFERYLALPPAFARFHPLRDGKTPREILLEQLDLLDREMKQILTDLHGRDAEALMAHGRFLRDKFARPDWLE